MSNYNIDEILLEYSMLTQNEKVIKERKTELSKIIKTFAEENGIKNSNGSSYCENSKYVFGRQAKKSVKLNFDKAKDYLIKNDLWNYVKEVQEIIDENKLEVLVSDGTIAYEDFETLVDMKTTYAVDVKLKTVSDSTEIPNVQMVASTKKPKILIKRK